MKKFFLIICLGLTFLGNDIYAQLTKDSWVLSFGGKYPRFINHNYSHPAGFSYGAYIGFQRKFSEHVAARLQMNIDRLQGVYGADLVGITNSLNLGLDMIYYFVPCEPVTPYLFFGIGPTAYLLENQPNAALSDFYVTSQINGGLGFEWELDTDWELTTELGYYTVFDAKFDGTAILDKGGLFGTADKSFFSFNLGFNYYLEKGEPSKYCQLYSGIVPDYKDMTDYDRIEQMIKENIPREIVKEVVVEKPVRASSAEKWVLVGVNFEFNSTKLTAESYPILLDATKTLLMQKDLDVEIQGYTDNIGSESYNTRLSQKRAEVVKNYLISKGVDSSRLSAVGYGESNPVTENVTAWGRAANRRIEFKTK